MLYVTEQNVFSHLNDELVHNSVTNESISNFCCYLGGGGLLKLNGGQMTISYFADWN